MRPYLCFLMRRVKQVDRNQKEYLETATKQNEKSKAYCISWLYLAFVLVKPNLSNTPLYFLTFLLFCPPTFVFLLLCFISLLLFHIQSRLIDQELLLKSPSPLIVNAFLKFKIFVCSQKTIMINSIIVNTV